MASVERACSAKSAALGSGAGAAGAPARVVRAMENTMPSCRLRISS